MRNVTSDRRPLIRTAALGLILTVSFALTGCGDSGGSKDEIPSGGGTAAAAAPSASAGPTDPAQWTKCLRDNGIDVKDPQAGAGTVELPADSPALTAAMNKCKRYETGQSGSTGAKPNDPQQDEQRRKFAKCMRDQGVDWPDPVPGQGMKVPAQTPELTAAFEKCSQQVPMDGSK
jgi:hypothetical protein